MDSDIKCPKCDSDQVQRVSFERYLPVANRKCRECGHKWSSEMAMQEIGDRQSQMNAVDQIMERAKRIK